MKAMIFLQEILSVVLTPLVLWFSLPGCAPGIMDFFREFSIHVDGLGYVCSFAVFDFKRHGNVNVSLHLKSSASAPVTPLLPFQFGAPTEQADERLQSKDGKMEKSFLAFKAAHPEWNPTDPAGSLYLSRLADLHNDLQPAVGHHDRQRSLSKGKSPTRFGDRQPSLHRSTLAERSAVYERALQQSMASANARRRGVGASLYMSAMPGPSRSSGIAPMSVAELQAESLRDEQLRQELEDGAEESDRAEDGGIGSRLGESFADDVKMRGGKLVVEPIPETSRERLGGSAGGGRGGMGGSLMAEEIEAEELANGGVLGLLAQIYDRRRGPMM